MARPLYRLDFSDKAFPTIRKLLHDPGQIGLVESEEGMHFEAAKEALLTYIREQRDHWMAQSKAAKNLKQDDVRGD